MKKLPNTGNVERILGVNKLVVATRLALGLALFAAIEYVVFIVFFEPSLVLASCIALAWGLVWLPLMLPLMRLLIKRQAILITDQGLVDKTGSLNFVAWEEIRDVHVRWFMGIKLVEFELFDVEPVLERLGLINRMLLRNYIRNYAGKPHLRGSFVQGGADLLVKIIRGKVNGLAGPLVEWA